MRLFQNAGLYKSYIPRLRALSGRAATFEELRRVFLEDRYGAAHTLQPVLEGEPGVFFTNADDEVLQRAWAREAGMPAGARHEDILRSQIEAHRTEVFYNSDPMRYGSDFVRRLPGCVRLSIAWRAAPSPRADFSAYDLVVCNFPAILRQFQAQGCRTAEFYPAHDPAMDPYAAAADRSVDVLFAGSYSRHHRQRARLLEAVAALADHRKVVLHLDTSGMTALAESPPGRLLPLGRFRRPASIRALAQPPVFGRDLYAALASSKIVLNGAIDMAGAERGNMRCWEALGCGALMVSDPGSYPPGMVDGVTMQLYRSPEDAARTIETALYDEARRRSLAAAGQQMIASRYSKQRQWSDFQRLCGECT
jgi:Glycosyl transferases group 1